MRKLIITENITVDGVIDLADDWFRPPSGADDESDILAAIREQDSAADGLLLGRQTFEDFRGYWPKQTDDPTGITDYLNRVTKYVVSGTLTDPGWQNTTILSGRLVAEVEAIKTAPGRDIVCTGSVTLTRALVASGLVDEYRLFVFPVVLGRGARLFADATEVPKLKLITAKPFRSGVVLLTYQPA